MTTERTKIEAIVSLQYGETIAQHISEPVRGDWGDDPSWAIRKYAKDVGRDVGEYTYTAWPNSDGVLFVENMFEQSVQRSAGIAAEEYTRQMPGEVPNDGAIAAYYHGARQGNWPDWTRGEFTKATLFEVNSILVRTRGLR
jgi:hypothetical protein